MSTILERLRQAQTVREALRIAWHVGAAARRWRHPVLARPLTQATDSDIDAALGSAELARADLFTPAGAVSSRRLQMGLMLAAHRIDVAWAVALHWREFKLADRACASCRSAGRCRRWHEWGGLESAPRMFCPNAALFEAIAAQQMTAAQTGPYSQLGGLRRELAGSCRCLD